jgi:hypothetical protein
MKTVNIATVFAAISAHGLRAMDKQDLEGFAGVEGTGYLCEPDEDHIIVVDALEGSVECQVIDVNSGQMVWSGNWSGEPR